MSGWQGARELHSDHGSVVAYRGMTDCFVRTVREEGFQALFKVRPPSRRAENAGRAHAHAPQEPGPAAQPAARPLFAPPPSGARAGAPARPAAKQPSLTRSPPPPPPPNPQGLWPNYLKVVPSIAIAFVTYEQVKELLGVEIRISE